MFHNLHLSTQPPPLSSLSTFLTNVFQSSFFNTTPPPIFISHLSTFLTSLNCSHSPPSLHLHLSSLNFFHSPPSTSLFLISLKISLKF
ncbi:hypothetical protein NC653_007157 [Populus alba x Populus x berolinensis]|uniref:Uncharacterized protein n=1 Tax=Populus alba x Populus x berolinensis TaxID=444605 RepID=A0AAD6RGT2_9ROSI|nr:hypothetical protein NC653_007157 [Populus alba x Populus x berolinensis]